MYMMAVCKYTAMYSTYPMILERMLCARRSSALRGGGPNSEEAGQEAPSPRVAWHGVSRDETSGAEV